MKLDFLTTELFVYNACTAVRPRVFRFEICYYLSPPGFDRKTIRYTYRTET